MHDQELKLELERLHPASFGWALHCCGRRREEAEDVLQAAYLKVLDGRARFDGRSSLKTWLFTVIRRTAGERRRMAQLRALAFGRWLRLRPAPAPAKDPEGGVCEEEARRALLQALSALTGRQQSVLHLVFYQGLSVEEASAVLSISVGSARTHFDRGKKRLRSLLAGEGGEA